MMRRIIDITLHIVTFLSALSILFNIINICYILFGGHGGGAGYEGYVIGSIVALILFGIYLVLYCIKKLIKARGKYFLHVHILCITNIVLYLIVWVYLITYAFQW